MPIGGTAPDAAEKRRMRQRTTGSGIHIKPCYTAGDVDDLDLSAQPKPGEFPFARGIQETMYRGRLWTMRQYAGFASAAESNARYRYLLAHGQTGLSVAFDLPTQMGYDSDSPMAAGEVGRTGVAIDSVDDMEALFDGIPMADVSVSMTINAPAAILLAMYLAVARRRGIPFEKLSGTSQNDILKEYAARGTYIYPPAASMRLVTDLMRYCANNVPGWNTISVSGYHIREAGATAVQELAFTLANARAYLEAAVNAGLSVDSVAPRMSFFWNAHNNFFEEIAKFRAARMLWAQLVRETFGARSDRSWRMRFHTQTGGSTLTAQDPENNVVRVALQALAAVLGGTQSLHTNGQDEALALPTAQSAKTALRTQQIIAHESGVPDTADPLGGSYFVERLTADMAAAAQQLLTEVAERGGAVSVIESGWMQEQIADSAYRAQRAIENGDSIVVGVNKYIDAAAFAQAPQLQRIDPSLEREQRERIAAVRGRRDSARASAALEGIRRAAEDDAALMPLFIEAVDRGCTLGEVCDALREIFSVYRPVAAV
ncbi:MAG: methylmalonyl-CoA mutase [Candidatus Eremiobacter antarcticus]|nr:methylmalonyl-CoA mutase [Candidatus Eremiobacteraeota bacterium]MBC5808690.1 methylmalonyl-CoA mutase [Candidatus Eremiobacteraeota bacterium]PZR62171.1 MAG: methylmalonyl-CoA mutase [Candidatus Eremiobacter sp. RRmetagenome_bin22]